MKVQTHLLLLGIASLACLSSCSSTQTSAQLDAKTESTLSAMSDKLAAARTLRVTTSRKASPGFNVAGAVAETATGTVVLQRPNQLAARMVTSEGSRSVGLANGMLTLVDEKAGTHASVKAAGDIDQAVRGVADTYGVKLPVAELLVNHPRSLLLEGVKSGRCVGSESIGGTMCHHLAFTQSNLTWDLWVAMEDNLPRRMKVTYPNGEGGAPLTMTADISRWEINPSLSASDLSVKVPAGSHEIEMIPIN
ncbi:MAG: DUF2092 domain-containing protein [Verrucomicrobiales bacterium]|nr:DUF2092 domain-containing protein [Verrucomicrobiales bacterium]